jgi:hydrogenase maturation protease
MTVPSGAYETAVRVLCLGNELLADDAVGIRIGRELQARWGQRVEVVLTALSGLHLIDCIVGARRLVVVDSVQTGAGKPGTIHVADARDVRRQQGGSPHGVGLFDVLEMAARAGLAVPEECTVVAVEAADCTCIGGPMHPDVEAAIRPAADAVARLAGFAAFNAAGAGRCPNPRA